MPRETVEAKAARYLVEQRLHVQAITSSGVSARCRGGDASYTLSWDGRDWSCSCPARGRCAHLVALWLVTVPAASPTAG
jgi:uncharacterized Zn finger protein